MLTASLRPSLRTAIGLWLVAAGLLLADLTIDRRRRKSTGGPPC